MTDAKYAKQLIRERTYSMRASLQHEAGEIVNYQSAIHSKLRTLTLPVKALTPYTCLPVGEIREMLSQPPERNIEKLKLCYQVFLDMEAGWLPHYNNISRYDRTRRYDRMCDRYVNNLRPAFIDWANAVQKWVDNMPDTVIENTCKAYLTSPGNRLPMAYCRAVRTAAKVIQSLMAEWLGLKSSDISQLEMRDPYMYYGKPTLETQHRMAAYQDVVATLVDRVSQTPLGRKLFEESGAEPAHDIPNIKEPHVDGSEPASLLGEAVLHIRADNSGVLSENMKQTRHRLQKVHSDHLAQSDDIPEHVIIDRVVKDPALFLKIAQQMKLEGIINPELIPSSSEEVNQRRADVVNQMSTMADSMMKNMRGLALAVGDVGELFDDLLGSAPGVSGLEHTNRDQRVNTFLKELTERDNSAQY